MQKTAATAAAVVVGPVGVHVDKVFFTHDGFDDKTQVFGDWIAIGFANDLTRVLNRKLNFEIFVPIGVDVELALPDPFGVVFVDVFDLEFVGNIEFFQSCQD